MSSAARSYESLTGRIPRQVARRARKRLRRKQEAGLKPRLCGLPTADCELLVLPVPRRRREIGELVGEAGCVAAVAAEAEALEAGVGETELRGQLLLVGGADLVSRRPRHGLRRLDLEPAVTPQAGGGRDQLADDYVLLQTAQAIRLALERGVRQDLGGLLERRGREERVGRERGLRDAEDDLLG